MCDITVSGSQSNINTVCKTSGKPITVANKHGMFCADMCDLAAAKAAHKELINMLGFDPDKLG